MSSLGTPCSTGCALLPTRCSYSPPPRAAPTFWPAWWRRPHDLRQHALSPSRSQTGAEPCVPETRATFGGRSGRLGCKKNRDSKVWAPRSAALYIPPASYWNWSYLFTQGFFVEVATEGSKHQSSASLTVS